MERDRSMVRGLAENPAQGRRPVPNSAATANMPPGSLPHPPLRKMTSTSSLSTSVSGHETGSLALSRSSSASSEAPSLTPGQVLNLARTSMRMAQTENESKIAEASASSTDFPPAPGVTIDWSHCNIEQLPEEVVDIIKNGLERLAISHNRISEFPTRFSECTSLWYLNVRYNQIKEFPLPLCDLRSLEILDLGNNLIETLPNEIVKLSSLKVLSLRSNRMAELPVCLSEMPSLQRLKLDGNDALVFPPREVIHEVGSPPTDHLSREDLTEREKVVTSRIKKYLKQYALEQAEAADDGSEGAEMPRLPTKRNTSGRFPIKVHGANLSDVRSPALSRPPPIPSRSHYRGLSQQNTTIRRPGVMPLTIGSVNERVRSNSETLLQSAKTDRPDSRARRMALVSAKTSQLGTLDELHPSNRLSHYRGLSHGSAMQSTTTTTTTNNNNSNSNNTNSSNGMSRNSPNTLGEPYLQRPIYVRRLSILPERRRESKIYDPVVETAKGVLYSVFQIHPMIQMLMSLTSDGANKRSSLEIVFYNTNSHVEELEQELQKHDPANHDDHDHDDENDDGNGNDNDGNENGNGPLARSNENIQRACRTLVAAYSHICTLLVDNIDTFVDKGDPRYIRTLLMQLWNSIMELRVTLGNNNNNNNNINSSNNSNIQGDGNKAHENAFQLPPAGALMGSTVRARSRENSVTPTADRPIITNGLRPRASPFHNPTNLRVATDVSGNYGHSNIPSASVTAATPRSGESFASASSRALSADFVEEDQKFERVFLSLQKASEIMMRCLPGFNAQIATLVKREMASRSPDMAGAQRLQEVIRVCNHSLHQTELLKKQMSMVKLKDPVVRRGESAFWTASNAFLTAWIDAGTCIKETSRRNSRPLPEEVRLRLRPVQKAVKETRDVMLQSPWHWIVRQVLVREPDNSPHADASGILSPTQSLPMTPQSAALGPAVQATVPSTPHGAAFIGLNMMAYDRSDTFSSFGGLSSSRTGTMTSATTSGTHSTHSTLNSLSSFSSLSDHGSGYMSPGSTTAMGIVIPPALPRLNGARGVY